MGLKTARNGKKLELECFFGSFSISLAMSVTSGPKLKRRKDNKYIMTSFENGRGLRSAKSVEPVSKNCCRIGVIRRTSPLIKK